MEIGPLLGLLLFFFCISFSFFPVAVTVSAWSLSFHSHNHFFCNFSCLVFYFFYFHLPWTEKVKWKENGECHCRCFLAISCETCIHILNLSDEKCTMAYFQFLAVHCPRSFPSISLITVCVCECVKVCFYFTRKLYLHYIVYIHQLINVYYVF